MTSEDLSGSAFGGAVLQRRIAEGVTADVYEALMGGDTVAVKVLAKEALGQEGEGRFVREGRILADLEHPNVLKIHKLGYERGSFFIVMAWISDGMNLEELVKKRPLKMTEALRITERLCEALTYLHARNLVHRDIKPSNVCLRRGGHPVLMDFSLIKDNSSSLALTKPGTVMGTVAFMPPEQASGGEVDARSDVYSLGATLFWLLTRQKPFQGKTPMDALVALVKEPAPAPSVHDSTIPLDVDNLVLEMLAKDPKVRPQSASEVVSRIRRILG